MLRIEWVSGEESCGKAVEKRFLEHLESSEQGAASGEIIRWVGSLMVE
jgi:hypothetical protein